MGLPAPGYQSSLIGNYPAGPNPWNLQPLALPPATNFYTPNQKLPAEEINWLLGTGFFNYNLLRAYVGPPVWRSGNPKSNFASTYNGMVCAAWDPFNLLWIIGTVAGPSGCLVNSSYGQDPQCVGGPSPDANTPALGIGATASIPATSMGLTYDPATPGVYWMGISNDDGTNNGKVYAYKYASSTWTGGVVATLSSSGTDLHRIEMATIGTTPVMAVGSTNAAVGARLLYEQSGTWFLTSVSQTGTVPWWYLKSNGSQILAMPGAVSGISSGQHYYTSPDGQTWTQQTLPLSVQGNNGQIVGLCWSLDSSGFCWIMAVWDTVALSTKFFRSSDGLTWGQQAAPATAIHVADLEAHGSLIAGTLLEAVSGGPSQAIYSVDGGITWYFASAALASSAAGSANYYVRPRMFGGPTQFLYLNDLWLRWSDTAGLPPLSL